MFWRLWLVVLKQLVFRLRLNVNAARFSWFVVEEAGGTEGRVPLTPSLMGAPASPRHPGNWASLAGLHRASSAAALLEAERRGAAFRRVRASPHLYRAASDPACGGSVGSVPNLLLERFKSVRKENVEAE